AAGCRAGRLLVLIVILTWNRGRRYIAAMESEGARFPWPTWRAAWPPARRHRVDGVAIYLTARNDLTPHALLHNIKHNHVAASA
ncbi:hypothetical protein ACQEPB_00005, partial [Novosphingobium fluoreni]